MKILNIAVLIFASCIAAKNVYYLDNLVSALKSGHTKREAKNVVNLEALHAALEEEEKQLEKDFGSLKKSSKRSQGVLQENEPLLQTLLPQVPNISIFSGYLRDNTEISAQMDNAEGFTVLFAPSDEAVSRFFSKKGLKPWEYPNQVHNDESDEDVIQKNIQYFIDAHTSARILKEDDSMAVELRNGQVVTIGQDESSGEFLLFADGSKYKLTSAGHAGNGILMVVDLVLVN